MTDLALYRKWRSQTFDDLVGQPHLTQTLRNAVASGKIAHAYLFCGPRGTGKTSAAKILAKALNCEKGPTPSPCNACVICAGITQGNILDVIEIDAASNRGIDEIRDLREKVKFAPTACRTKVYIIDEVHMLTTEAFNALLKTLEEPPPQTVFVLCTTEPHKLLPTVTSRCQRFDFKRISLNVIEARLLAVCRGEGIEVEPGVLSMVAVAAEGSLRDALSLLDQLRTFCPGTIKKEEAAAVLGQTPHVILSTFVERIAAGDLKSLLMYLHQMLEEGIDLTQLIRDLLIEFRKILLVKIAPESLENSPDEISALANHAAAFEIEWLYRALRILADLRQELRYSQHPRLSAELGFIRLLKAHWEPSVEGLKRRLDRLESEPSGTPLGQSRDSPGTVPGVSRLSTDPSEVKVTLEAVEAEWPKLIEGLRSSRDTLFSILQEAAPMQLEGNLLTLLFSYEFHKNRFEQKKEQIRKFLQDRFGVSFDLAGIVKEVDHKAVLREATELFPGSVLVKEG